MLDTNVIISALRSRRGASAKLLSLLDTGLFEIHVSVPLALEYEELLTRQRTELGLSQDDVADLVDSLCSLAKHQEIHFSWRPSLPDQRDEFILDLAVAARCDAVVTCNQRDFAGLESFGIRVITAKELLHERGVIS